MLANINDQHQYYTFSTTLSYCTETSKYLLDRDTIIIGAYI